MNLKMTIRQTTVVDKLFLALICLVVSAIPKLALAQFTTTVEKVPHDSNIVAESDLWFGIPNDEASYQGFIQLMVTSSTASQVTVQYSGGGLMQDIAAGSIAAFNIPLNAIIRSSDMIENLGMHIHATSAVVAMLQSHWASSGDVTQILPEEQCSTDYVIASYAAGNVWGDTPSEFVVTAFHDSTQVTVTPSCDLRGNTSDKIAHPAGVPFTVLLNIGEEIQYEGFGSDSGADVTGTFVHSTAPIAVFGASQSASIPAGYSPEGHIMSQMLPISGWGSNYYTMPSFGRLRGNTYLLVNTVKNQTIYRQDSLATSADATMDSLFSTHWDHDISIASRWYSDAPFYLVKYENSANWDCDACTTGSPAMAVIFPIASAQRRLTLQVPTSQGSQSPYAVYANIAVQTIAEQSTLVDATPISQYPHSSVDGIYDMYRVPNLKPGSHIVTSDSGVRADIYGFVPSDAFSYGIPDSVRPTFDPNYTTPAVSIDSGLRCLSITISDTAGILSLRQDSLKNLTVNFDSTVSGPDSTALSCCVVDTLSDGMVTLTIMDKTFNQTIVRIFRPGNILQFDTGYTAKEVSLFLPLEVGKKESQFVVSLDDTANSEITIDSIWSNDKEFVFDSLNVNATRVPFIINPKASLHEPFFFNPSDTGLRVGTISFRSSSGQIRTVVLHGIGLNATASVKPDVLPFVTISPNPGSGNFHLRYSLADAGAVNLRIYDLLGNLQSVFNYFSSIGISEQDLDLRALPAGEYVYRFETHGQVHSGKVILVR